MKQKELSTALEKRVSPPATVSRLTASSKGKDSIKPGSFNGVSSPFSKSRNSSATTQSRKSLVLNRTDFGEEAAVRQQAGKVDGVRVFRRPSVEQNSRLPRNRRSDNITVTNAIVDDSEGKRIEFQKKLCLNEKMIKDLQSQVSSLIAELDISKTANVELQLQNSKLSRDLAAAEAKIASLICNQNLKGFQKEESLVEYRKPQLGEIPNGVVDQLAHSSVRTKEFNETSSTKALASPPLSLTQRTSDLRGKTPLSMSLPPPPPPPLPPRRSSVPTVAQKAPHLVQLFHSLTKKERERDSPTSEKFHNLSPITAHRSIVGEIQNRSSHLLAIKADIETKGDFVNDLIKKVLVSAFTDIEEVLKFVDWLDGELSSLSDERAVLKHFKWPEKKADAMREAAVEFRALKLLEREIRLYEDDSRIPCENALKKITSFLDKSEQSVQWLIRLRNTVLRSYQDCKIPIDWMLDTGMESKIKKASMNLAKKYMKRVKIELEVSRITGRESIQESLLLQGIRFAYRTHQFAGGLDSETMSTFEEIRGSIPLTPHLGELSVGVPSS